VQPLLKQLSQNISFGYKILVQTQVNGKGGILGGRHLPQAMLGAVHTLGQQMLHCYENYQRVPRAVWSECLAIYQHARHLNRGGYTACLAGNPPLAIDAKFRLIALLKLADPYQLHPGMLAALQGYIHTHIDLTRIIPDAGAYLDATILTLVLNGQQLVNQTDDNISIDVTALLKQMQTDTIRLEKHPQARVDGQPNHIPTATLLAALKKTLQLWQSERERASSRESAAVGIELITGLESAYCVINRDRPFDPARYLTGSEGDNIEIGTHGKPEPAAPQQPATALHCATSDRNSGGLGISYRGKSPVPRVGQLMAMRRLGPRPGDWVLAVCRWVVQAESVAGFDAGLQYLTREPAAAVIRPIDANGFSGEFQPAIAADQKRGGQPVQTLIARANQLHSGDAFVLCDERGVQHRARCIELLESGAGFDRFIYRLLPLETGST
jgi:hypothetical protein